MKRKVEVIVESCSECPFFRTFDTLFPEDYMCRYSYKKISSVHDSNSLKKIKDFFKNKCQFKAIEGKE